MGLNDLTVGGSMIAFVFVSLALSLSGAYLSQPLVRSLRNGETGWNEVVGGVLSCFGVFYGILLGLLAVAAFQRLESAEARVNGEASLVAGVYGAARLYPEPTRTELLQIIRKYLQTTVEQDWPTTRVGRIPVDGIVVMRQLRSILHTFVPSGAGQEILHASVIQQLDEIGDLRRHRIYTATIGLPRALWIVVALGSFLNMLLLWLLDTRLANKCVLVGIVASFLGVVIWVLVLLDNPYQGPLAVGANPFQKVLEFTEPR